MLLIKFNLLAKFKYCIQSPKFLHYLKGLLKIITQYLVYTGMGLVIVLP